MHRARACIAAACAGLLLLSLQDAAAHGVSLEVHHALPEDSAFHRDFLVPWARKVEQESGGRMRFHLHAASTAAGSVQGLYEKVEQGAVDLAWLPITPTPDRFPRLAAMEVPFTVRTAQGGSRALWEYARLNDVLDRDLDGVRVIALALGDGSQLHWGKLPAGAPAQVSGRRIAAVTELDAALLGAMGASVVQVTAERVAEVLEKGTAEAALLPWEGASAIGVDGLSASHVEVGAHNAGMTSRVFVFAMSAGSYRSLSEDLKAVMDANSGRETCAWLGRVLDDAAARARKAAIAQGHRIRDITPEERERWLQAARSVADARVKAFEQADVRLRPLLESAREQLQEFDSSR
jgi:TRAP-type C4-dicarboxylate transport system substrate-binding protein